LADLVYIGRFNAQKNLPALIRAAALSGASLDLYGGGELEPKLKALAAETGAKVTFRGRVANDRIPALLAQYKAFILPSLFEGNPKALLEAMACGCAVIASDAPGIAGLITHGENGYLCAPDNEAALAAAIRTVLDDGELRARMGLAARDQVCRHNSYAHYINEETKRIESITGS
jgi:glycosyltransferase involved in cell wall biosynthesis